MRQPKRPSGTKKASARHFLKAGTAAATAVLATTGAVLAPHSGSGFPEVVNGCTIYGSSEEGKPKGEENKLKNRYTFPEDDQIDWDVTLDALLSLEATSNDPKAEMAKKFDETKAGQISGYVVDVIPGGIESCNCKTTVTQYKDTHIYIGPKADSKKSECVIVEITPRIRILKASGGIDWSTPEVKKLKGKYVQVTGWLFFDGEHWTNAADNPKHGKSVWRRTCWELHPVTDLQVATP